MRIRNIQRFTAVVVMAVTLLAFLCAVIYIAGNVSAGASAASAPESTRGKTVEEMLGASGEQEAPVYWNGKWYRRAADREAYLFIGVDNRGTTEDAKEQRGGGQSDVLLLLVIDHADASFRVLQLDRDTMTNVCVLGADGSVLDTKYLQLEFAHTYGDGMEKSSENTVRAVSDLLYGVTIDGYASLLMDSIPILNDMVGGVTVTIEDNLASIDATLIQGQTITLMGEHAMHFVHARRDVGDGSNTARMHRHRTYLRGFEQQLRASMADDPEFVLKLYASLRDYLVSDISSGVLSRVAQQCLQYENGGTLTLEGESRLGEKLMEFYPDEDALHEIVLDLFYEEAPEEVNSGE